jgi:hypothetical protein
LSQVKRSSHVFNGALLILSSSFGITDYYCCKETSVNFKLLQIVSMTADAIIFALAALSTLSDFQLCLLIKERDAKNRL